MLKLLRFVEVVARGELVGMLAAGGGVDEVEVAAAVAVAAGVVTGVGANAGDGIGGAAAK